MTPSISSTFEHVLKTATPGLFARSVSQGKWTMPPHLHLLDKAITDTITGQGGIRNLLVTMPPRHGKSELCSKYLPAWYLGTYPDRRVILGSYEGTFASGWGRKARNLLETVGWPIFGINVAESPSAADNWDIEGYAGGMQTAGAGGAITGKGGHLIIIDDPIKGSKEAKSQTYRDTIWNWYTGDVYTRREPGAAVIVIQTRWNEDDLAGRLLNEAEAGGDQWRVVNMPAINHEGQALWPARFPIEELEKIRRTIGGYNWNALYQQRPTPPEGGAFKRSWFPIVPSAPSGVRKVVRYWDKAATEGDGDYTVGVLMGELDGIVYVIDVERGQWGPHNRDANIEQTAELDKARYPRVRLWMEEEGGSAGKDVSLQAIRRFARFGCRTEHPTGDKEHRAEPFAARAEAGDVRLVAGKWNKAYLDELAAFPHGANDDQVDGSSGAYNRLVTTGGFAVGV